MTTLNQTKPGGPYGPNQTFRTINDRPMRYMDKTGLTHACEGADVHPGVRLLWTLCERDVPANEAFLPRSGESYEMCVVCMKRRNDGEKVTV